MIASLDDPRVAAYRDLGRPDVLRETGLFVAEGRLVVRRLLSTPRFRTRSILVTEPAHESLSDVLSDTAADVYVVDQQTMNGIAGFNIHRGCLALADRPPAITIDELPLDSAHRLVVLEGVNNPDNVGGIFRSAAAFGVDAVILGPACSDPLYRKSVRTSMAAVLTVPFAGAGPWPDALATLDSRGFRIVALTPADDSTRLEEVTRKSDRVALLVGAEGHGLSRAALSHAHVRARVPMTEAVDSLNVTVAASIAMYLFRRL